jgi:hypothetical protein
VYPRPQRKSSTPEPSPMESAGRAFVGASMALRDPARPSRRLPRLVARLLPDPMRSLEDWQRYAGSDLVDVTPAERAWEAFRLRTAAALIDDPDRIPPWLLGRLAALES